MSVSYKMKHAKQHAWTIEEKNEDGSNNGAKLKQKILTVLCAFGLMVVIGLCKYGIILQCILSIITYIEQIITQMISWGL